MALGLIGPMLAHAADAPPKACEVVVQTRNGGLLDVLPAARQAGSPGAAAQIVWRPPTSGSSVQFLVVYPPGPLTRLGEPSGLMIGFQIQPNLPTDSAMLIVKAQNGRSWRFNGAMIEFGKDSQATVKFEQDWAYGRGLLGAIADSQPLSMSVEQAGKPVAGESFALGNIDARDRLLAQARAQVESAEPGGCLK
jgi:hypothetical protein